MNVSQAHAFRPSCTTRVTVKAVDIIKTAIWFGVLLQPARVWDNVWDIEPSE